MARIICPFCLKPHDFRESLVCPTYSEVVPSTYVNEYHQVAPMWLATVGFSQHGKTTYLAALTLMLRQISKVLEGVFYRPLDDYTFKKIQEMQREAVLGQLPAANTVGLSRPLLFSVYNLPQGGSRCLVMYDVAGETYNSLGDVSRYVPSIKQVNTTWFLVSLADLDDDREGKLITDLFHSYLSGMETMRADLKGRNLIVIYTKADKIPFTPQIREYLRSDSLQGLTRKDQSSNGLGEFSTEEYLQKMQEMSDLLEEYTRQNIDGGAAFINMVKGKNLNLVFSLCSALGQDPDQESGSMRENAVRYRVLDPFFWAVALEQKLGDEPLALVLDAFSSETSAYDDSLIQPLWDALSGHGELTTHYLGELLAVSGPGQTPPVGSPSGYRHRLIGPILEHAPSDSKIAVITAGQILDLADFHDTSWEARLVLVNIGEIRTNDWSNMIHYRLGDNPQVIVDRLLRL